MTDRAGGRSFAARLRAQLPAAGILASVLAVAACAPQTKAPVATPPPPTEAPAPEKPAEVVNRIAVLVPLSGTNAPVGVSLANAASLALVDTRKQGIRISSYDTAALGAREAARRAIADGAGLILGPLLAQDAQAIKTEAGAKGITAFLVPAGLPGLSLGKPDKKMGQRGTKTCDVYLDNVRVPAANIIGGIPGKGFKTAMKVLDQGRLHISAVACGMASRIQRESIAYAQQRKQFGKHIGEFQLVQAMMADSQAELLAAWSLVQASASRYDGKPAGVNDPEVSMQASCAKMYATEMVGRVADRGVQIHGGSGYVNEYKVERFYRDVRLLRIYEGTSQIQQLLIARQILKEA